MFFISYIEYNWSEQSACAVLGHYFRYFGPSVLRAPAEQTKVTLQVTLQKRVPKNFRSCRWGAEQRVSRAQTRERGPPSA